MVGIDEVGRGSWAGPLLVVAARGSAKLPPDLRDSKLMTKNQRYKTLDLLSICCNFGEGWVTAAEIDRHGLAGALKRGVERALKRLGVDPEEQIIMDGSVSYIPRKYSNSRYMIGADNLVPEVSAASIWAKTRRDTYMRRLAGLYPDYGFDSHVGYGTPGHGRALSKLGVIKNVHRLSFKPVSGASS